MKTFEKQCKITAKGGVFLKLTINIDKSREEEIIIYTHRHSELITAISELVNEQNFTVMGYSDYSYKQIDLAEIVCFIAEDNKIYAVTNDGKHLIKLRLYQLEEKLPANFVKINQSCIANIKQIKKFDVSVSGTMLIIFKNGYRDYVSRRQLKSVKERVGI